MHTSKNTVSEENNLYPPKLSFYNPPLSLQIKYKEEWEKTKSKACDIGVDTLTVKAAKASRDLASNVSRHKSTHSSPLEADALQGHLS